MPVLHLAHQKQLAWGEGQTRIMGVLNITPDSFSDGGQFDRVEAAAAHALQMLDDGADIIDIGGESSRPGAEPVSEADELQRVLPVIERIIAERPDAFISIDTVKPEVAQQAVAAGACLFNDITGGQYNEDIWQVVADTGAGYCLMHMQGTPQTMQQNPEYKDVVDEVQRFFEQQVAKLESLGVPRERLMVDPGIGFGKTLEHNLALINASGRFGQALNLPVLLGVSRKSMLKQLTGIEDPQQRDIATVAAHVAGVMQGVAFVRTHNVRYAHESLLVADALQQETSH
jgi:dihydropteroate synthase